MGVEDSRPRPRFRWTARRTPALPGRGEHENYLDPDSARQTRPAQPLRAGQFVRSLRSSSDRGSTHPPGDRKMTAAATDFERLLREALDQATANAPQANKDLVRLAS